MKRSKLLYFSFLAIVTIGLALFEYGILPTYLIPPSPTTTYIVDLASTVTAFGGCFALLYAFRFVPVRTRFESLQGAAAEAFALKICNIRLAVWFVLILANMVLYYEATNVTNPKYGIIVLFIAFVFCWPAMPATKTETTEKAETTTKENSEPTTDE